MIDRKNAFKEGVVKLLFIILNLKWVHGDSATVLGMKMDADRCETKILFKLIQFFPFTPISND